MGIPIEFSWGSDDRYSNRVEEDFPLRWDPRIQSTTSNNILGLASGENYKKSPFQKREQIVPRNQKIRSKKNKSRNLYFR